MTDEETAAPPLAERPTSPGKLLVVDDEVIVGRMIGRIFRGQHEVVVLTEATEALALFQQGERFAAILCDLMMPRMSGMDLYEALLQIDAEQATRMIFLTGGAFTTEARMFLDEIANPRLEKPFEPRALRELVAARLRDWDGGRIDSPLPGL